MQNTQDLIDVLPRFGDVCWRFGDKIARVAGSLGNVAEPTTSTRRNKSS
jgi:hypothetical protein